MAVQPKECMTYQEIADEYGMTTTSARWWAKRGGWRAYRDPRRKSNCVMFRRTDVEEYAAHGRKRPWATSQTTQLHDGGHALPVDPEWRWECRYCQYKDVRGHEEVCTRFALPQLARVADDGDCVYYGVRPGDLPRPAARDWRVCRHDGEVREGRCMRCGRRVEGVEG